MEPVRFDRIAKLFAGRRLSRREALTTSGAGLAAASLGALGSLAAADLSPAATAQDATPPPSDAEPNADHGPTMLFVQTYQSGSIAPIEGVDGRYTLTLDQGHGQTIYFSDRPDRIVGATDTPRFLTGLGFPDENPPNAALVVETAPGETDVAVVELFNPLYDPSSQGVTYDIAVLANWRAELGMGFHDAPTDLAALAPAFGAAQLFIDDCPGDTMYCYVHTYSIWDEAIVVGSIADREHDGFCYSWGNAACLPCQPWLTDWPALRKHWAGVCNARFSKCQGACYAYPLCSVAGWCDPFWA